MKHLIFVLAASFLYFGSNIKLYAQDFVWDGQALAPVPLLESSRQNTNSLKLLSWNLGSVDWSIQLQQAFLKNLKSIIASQEAPDLLVFVETRPENLKLLEKVEFHSQGYENSLVLSHVDSQTRTEFVALFWKSKRLKLKGRVDFPLEYKQNPMQNEGLDFSVSRRIQERVERDLPFVKKVVQNEIYFVLDNEYTFRLFPVHLTNIWSSVANLYYEDALTKLSNFKNMPDFLKASTATLDSKKGVLQEILYSESNPHFIQTKSLIKQVQDREVPAILLGDFNTFPRLSTITSALMLKNATQTKSRACSEFEASFKAVYPKTGASFPSLSFASKKTIFTPEMLIDYAYTWGDLWKNSEAYVLPLKGSDHYPIVYEIQYE